MLGVLIGGQMNKISGSCTIVVHGGTAAERTALINEQLWQCSRNTNFRHVNIQPWFMSEKEPFMRLYREAFLVPCGQEQITEVATIMSLTAFFLGTQANSDWPERLAGTLLGDHWNGLSEYKQAAWRKEM